MMAGRVMIAILEMFSPIEIQLGMSCQKTSGLNESGRSEVNNSKTGLESITENNWKGKA